MKFEPQDQPAVAQEYAKTQHHEMGQGKIGTMGELSNQDRVELSGEGVSITPGKGNAVKPARP